MWTQVRACNISYAEAFSKEQFSDVPLKVIDVDMTDLHSIPEYIKNKQFYHIILELRKRFKRWLFQRYAQFLKSRSTYIDYDNMGMSQAERYVFLENVWKRVSDYLKTIKKKPLFVHAYSGIVIGEERLGIDYSAIVFNDKYVKKADILVKDINVCGVHIRRTDHDIAIAHSTDIAFYQNIESQIKSNQFTTFFLATDDKVTEKNIMDRYKGKIIIQQGKDWGRDFTEGMGSAIVDLICLSRCKTILGSYTSCFTWFAAMYGKSELIVCEETSA